MRRGSIAEGTCIPKGSGNHPEVKCTPRCRLNSAANLLVGRAYSTDDSLGIRYPLFSIDHARCWFVALQVSSSEYGEETPLGGVCGRSHPTVEVAPPQHLKWGSQNPFLQQIFIWKTCTPPPQPGISPQHNLNLSFAFLAADCNAGHDIKQRLIV